MHRSPSPPLDSSGEPQTPQRSPSRLDFCMQDVDEGDSPPHRMDWSSTSFRDCPYTFIEDAFAVDIAPPAVPRLLVVEDPVDAPPPATNPCTHESTDTPPPFFAPPDPMDPVVVEPQAPVPIRPPSMQNYVDVQESMPPPRPTPQRLKYPHRGFSRSALEQQKSLWNSRHGEWAQWQSRVEQSGAQRKRCETNDAYTGLAIPQPRVVVSPPPYIRTPPSGLERDLADRPPSRHAQNVHASIYPRVGDISALRDPYSVNIDRSFFRFPLWTLHKTLYAFNMQHRSASLGPSASAYSPPHVPTSVSSSTLSAYSSSTSGDEEDSDSTLVADDSPVPKSHRPLEPVASTSPPHGWPSWGRFFEWEFSWYARWELLIDIFQGDHIVYNPSDSPFDLATPVGSGAAPSSPPERIFCFTVEDDDDDDEDYGTLVTESSFSVDFDEECERALAFYNRELESTEVTL